MRRRRAENIIARWTAAAAACAIAAGMLAAPVFAETNRGGSDWAVTYNQGAVELDANFTPEQFQDVFKSMQPGDDAEVTLTLSNKNSATVDWYMNNKILSTLEESSGDYETSGGIYYYRLVYDSPNDDEDHVLISSDTVGGEYEDGRDKAAMGLKEINDGYLMDYDPNNSDREGDAYFYLDKLSSGQSGKLTLYIKLDGETQGNFYQDTLAAMEMKFAVDLPVSPTPSPTPTPEGYRPPWRPHWPHRDTPQPPTTVTTSNPPKSNGPVFTGDNSRIWLYAGLMGGAGILCLILALAGRKMRKNDPQGTERSTPAHGGTKKKKKKHGGRSGRLD